MSALNPAELPPQRGGGPMRLHARGAFYCPGLHGRTMGALAHVYLPERGVGRLPVVVLTECDDNPGASITNAYEQVATCLWWHYRLLMPDGCVWVEHYPHGGPKPVLARRDLARWETFSEVRCEPERNPRWLAGHLVTWNRWVQQYAGHQHTAYELERYALKAPPGCWAYHERDWLEHLIAQQFPPYQQPLRLRAQARTLFGERPREGE